MQGTISDAVAGQDSVSPCCDRCAILAVMQRYGDIVELADFEQLDQVFVIEARIVGDSFTVEGRDAIIDMLSGLPRPRAHLFSAGHLVAADDDEAVARFTAVIVRTNGEMGVSRIEDRLTRFGDRWLVTERRLTSR